MLYELVMPENVKAPRPGDPPSRHPISIIQNGMKDILELKLQLEKIDYTRKNMVHADMSPDQFAHSMQGARRERVEHGRAGDGIRIRPTSQGNGANDGELLAALFDKNRVLAMKRVFAEQFSESEGTLAALEGPNGSTLISGRNKVALDVLRKEIAAGKKKIAIFYGAGHMPNFEKRLRSDFGLAPVSTRWLVAWNLKTRSAGQAGGQAAVTCQLGRQLHCRSGGGNSTAAPAWIPRLWIAATNESATGHFRMAQLSISETTTFRWSFEEDVTQYGAAGIPAIGIWRHKLSDCGQSKALDLLRRSGLKVSHLFWAGGFTGGDGRSHRESIEDAADAVRTAAALDCRILVLYSGPRAGHTGNHARRLVQGRWPILPRWPPSWE